LNILLAQNSLYYPAHGGGDKSNRLLIEALAARGHNCRVVARVSEFGAEHHHQYIEQLAERKINATVPEPGVVAFERSGVEVFVVTGGNPRAHFASQAEEFHPDIILVSTDDPAQLLLEAALRDLHARVVYLARATLAVPFGPDSAFPSEAKTDRLRAVDAVVGVSRYVADYIEQHSGIDAVHVPISLMEPVTPSEADASDADPAQPACLGRFENEFITFVNPCAVKGISIFLSLADTFPDLAFAAVPTWGTNKQDREALRERVNVTVLRPTDDIDSLLEWTRVLLVPSLWAEARSRIVVEAMLRGVPVIASNVGGIPEAKLGVPYLLPVNPIVHYEPSLDEKMVPQAEVPPQDISQWSEALNRLTTDRDHYTDIAGQSRKAALEYAEQLSVKPFEKLLLEVAKRPVRRAAKPAAVVTQTVSPAAATEAALKEADRTKPVAPPTADDLSAEKRRLLAIRLRQKAPANAYFPGAAAAGGPRLFCLPHAGAGAAAYAGWKLESATVCPIRLPGRESRISEAPFERMNPLVSTLADSIVPYLDRPYALFGHSMGAVVGFELARELRRRGKPAPRVLIASGARAPQYRRDHVPPPDATDEELLDALRQLDGAHANWFDIPAVAHAILPALRADTTLYRHYIYREDDPLDCPIHAYGGEIDPHISVEHLRNWSLQTRQSFQVRQFPGGHFYLQPARPEFRDALEQDLRCAWA
jgi:surfactin synthase thioesterase subunit/glycosyltransferase involved in cell wall biosynthesis